ncbi:hypothetical protein FQA39_LY14112 [Lamprigera yunnana]|nr:hypothetical protein FQA39_LY14112 [Lamprigera yunnana]
MQSRTMSIILALAVCISAVLGGYPNRPLLIKSYPGIENIQSDLYEVYQEPFTYGIHPSSAVAIIKGEENDIKGEISFLQRHPPTGAVLVKGNFSGLPAGKHGLHIHQSGDLRNGCKELGGHFNPFLLEHGSPKDGLRHVGDLGNVKAKEDGASEFEFVDPLLSLIGGGRNIVGRAVVITENEDDLGRGGTAESLTTGSSGKAIACGVIAYVV